jgi:hypothetical protein
LPIHEAEAIEGPEILHDLDDVCVARLQILDRTLERRLRSQGTATCEQGGGQYKRGCATY